MRLDSVQVESIKPPPAPTKTKVSETKDAPMTKTQTVKKLKVRNIKDIKEEQQQKKSQLQKERENKLLDIKEDELDVKALNNDILEKNSNDLFKIETSHKKQLKRKKPPASAATTS